jgi:F-type H+-transporting ATPase subunit c
VAGLRAAEKTKQQKTKQNMIPLLLAEAATAAAGGITGSFTLGMAGAGAGIGIGLIGAKAAESVGRNPGAFGRVLTIGIIGMALAEAIAIYALIRAFAGQ